MALFPAQLLLAWVAAKELNSSYYYGGTVVITMYTHMGCSQNYGSLLVIGYITAPNS